MSLYTILIAFAKLYMCDNTPVESPLEGTLSLMLKILQHLPYTMLLCLIGFLYMRSCRISFINSRSFGEALRVLAVAVGFVTSEPALAAGEEMGPDEKFKRPAHRN